MIAITRTHTYFEMRSLAPGDMDGGYLISTLLMRLYVAREPSASNGGLPTKNSYVSTPRDQISAVASWSLPSTVLNYDL